MIINRTPEFKRNYKLLKRKHYDMNKLKRVINLLVAGANEELIRKHKITNYTVNIRIYVHYMLIVNMMIIGFWFTKFVIMKLIFIF